MSCKNQCLYKNNHNIPVHRGKSFCEDRNLSIIISDYGDRLFIKIKDPSDCQFNYAQSITSGDFDIIKLNQSLDINYVEFKTHIVNMLNQFQKKEMFLKCILNENSCVLTFYTKSVIKSIVYLFIDLSLEDQSEIINEIHSEMTQLQGVNRKLQNQLINSEELVRLREQESKELQNEKQVLFNIFIKNLKNIDEVINSERSKLQQTIDIKINHINFRLLLLRNKMEIVSREAKAKITSLMEIKQIADERNVELFKNNHIIQDLKKEITTLNIGRVSSERNVADLKNEIEKLRDEKTNMEQEKVQLLGDLQELSIIVNRKDTNIDDLSKDLVQANNILVQLNKKYNDQVEESRQLQEALVTREKLLKEERLRSEDILKKFREYQNEYDRNKSDNMKAELVSKQILISNLEGEMRRLSKINALLSKKVGELGA